MSTNTEQGTPEWLKARVGKITGSRVGAILGKSPFTSRKKVMREMADEMLGNHSDFDNPAMRYGREKEDTAAKLYEFLYAGDQIVSQTGFWEKGDLGASPDRLVGDKGLVEIKCPYSLRDEKQPQWKSIKDQPHYYHQIQLQLYATDRDWCDFFQWNEHDHNCERVQRDVDWYRMHEEEFVVFLGELDDLLKKVSKGGSEERVGMSARWAALSEAYHLASITAAQAKAEMDDAKQGMIDLMEASEIDHCRSCNILLQKTMRKGTVDYRELAYDGLGEDQVKQLEEDFRRKGSTSWTIKEVDDE